jgi:hypothetical protein
MGNIISNIFRVSELIPIVIGNGVVAVSAIGAAAEIQKYKGSDNSLNTAHKYLTAAAVISTVLAVASLVIIIGGAIILVVFPEFIEEVVDMLGLIIDFFSLVAVIAAAILAVLIFLGIMYSAFGKKDNLSNIAQNWIGVAGIASAITFLFALYLFYKSWIKGSVLTDIKTAL